MSKIRRIQIGSNIYDLVDQSALHGHIEKNQLAEGVQNSLNKADSSIQSIGNQGLITINQGVQGAIGVQHQSALVDGTQGTTQGLYRIKLDNYGHITNADPFTFTNGDNISITTTNTGISISSTNTTYSGGTGITISNVEGTNYINHSNNLGDNGAQTSEFALRRIKYDQYGHITGSETVLGQDIEDMLPINGIKKTITDQGNQIDALGNQIAGIQNTVIPGIQSTLEEQGNQITGIQAALHAIDSVANPDKLAAIVSGVQAIQEELNDPSGSQGIVNSFLDKVNALIDLQQQNGITITDNNTTYSFSTTSDNNSPEGEDDILVLTPTSNSNTYQVVGVKTQQQAGE